MLVSAGLAGGLVLPYCSPAQYFQISSYNHSYCFTRKYNIILKLQYKHNHHKIERQAALDLLRWNILDFFPTDGLNLSATAALG